MTDQPDPKPGDEVVCGYLLNRLGKARAFELHGVVQHRVAVGLDRYGTYLMTHNGRDAVQDAKEEIGDAAQYIEQARLEGRDLDELRTLWRQLGVVLGVEDGADDEIITVTDDDEVTG